MLSFSFVVSSHTTMPLTHSSFGWWWWKQNVFLFPFTILGRKFFTFSSQKWKTKEEASNVCCCYLRIQSFFVFYIYLSSLRFLVTFFQPLLTYRSYSYHKVKSIRRIKREENKVTNCYALNSCSKVSTINSKLASFERKVSTTMSLHLPFFSSFSSFFLF
jgi:hypothetical protein